MNTKNVARGLVSRLQRISISVLVVAILLGSLPVSNAHAWSYIAPVGRPGSVNIPTISIGDLLMPSGLVSFTLYGNTGPIAYRSPASTGAQSVAAQYLVEKWDGSRWVLSAKSGMMAGTINATQTSIRFPAPYLQPVIARGIFRFKWIFAWTTTSGSSLGGIAVQSNLTTDHVCVTPYRLCQSYPGYFQTGGYRTGSW